ncbi:uncharacterized protein ATC70_010545 [Mucor velutinosus]|uniref:Integrase catalytic domain-containing protein n=1 Tax=Mucor velutinosus TaxID=708070 RepID=A0AAN7DFH2_9FUNG|nr:hypothetical protein ATC70_010545 [Mucor velutinosus]
MTMNDFTVSPAEQNKSSDVQAVGSELSYGGAVERLRQEVHGLIAEVANSGDKSDEEVDALKAALSKKCSNLEAIEKALSMVTPNQSPSQVTVVSQGAANSSTVPDDLPLFQWFGRVKDEKKEVFANIEECCRRFSDKLSSCTLDLDEHWYRLLPPCLPGDLRNWLDEFVKASGSTVSWATLKGAIIGRFGTPKEQLRFERIREFLRCTKGNEESVDGFVERFKTLRNRADISDKGVVAMVFFDAFPKVTARLLMVAMSQAPESSFYDIDYVSSLVRKMDMMAIETGQESLGSVFDGRKRAADIPVSNEAKKSRYAPSSSGNALQSSSSSRSNGPSSNSPRSGANRFGKTFAEHIAEGTCSKCNGPQPKGQMHHCNTAIRTGGGNTHQGNGGKKVLRAMTKKRGGKHSMDAAIQAAFLSARVDRALAEKGASSPAVSSAEQLVDDVVLAPSSGDSDNVDVDQDAVMSEAHGIFEDTDLVNRAQSILLEKEMSSMSVDDDTLQNIFAQRSIYLLGWSVINGKLLPDGRKLTNIADWPAITTGRQLASFLGLMSYFRAAIPCYSRLTRDLDSLKQYKDLTDVWNESHTKAIADLKDALTMALVLSPPDFSIRFHLATDASLTALGAVLYQVVNDEIRYVGLVSRKLSVSERNYSTTKRELLGICYALVKFHRFLYMREFTLHTDHKSLIYLNTQEVPNALMLGWWETIFSYTFDIVHLPGVLNVIPDALSRLYEDSDADASARHLLGGRYYADGGESVKRKKKGSKNKVKVVTPSPPMKRTLVKTTKALRSNSFSNHARTAVNATLIKDGTTTAVSQKQKEFILRTLRFADYITPPANERDNMIIAQHLVGHFGIKHVETAIHHEGFRWVNIRKDIERILADCDECNRYNIAREGYHPFRSVNAAQPLDHWCMDLGDMDVTSSFGSNFLFVLTDYFTRFTVIRCIPDKKATTIAREMLQVFSLFGWPIKLTSDRGLEWINEVVRAMMDISGIDHRLSLGYNPLGNSVSESFIKICKLTTIKLLKGKRDQWEHFIPWVNYCINVKYARLHKSRPYTLLFNRQPNGLADYSKVDYSKRLEKADNRLIDKRYRFVQDVLIPAISKRIVDTQNADHANFAKKHKVIAEPYPIGSKVMIKNVHRQNKLDERYEGPYLIRSITDKGSYVLADKTGALLSRDVPTHHIKYQVAANPQPITIDEFSAEHYEIQAVIDHRGSPGNYEYKVKWKGFDDPSEDTWEPVKNFDSAKHIELYWARREGAKAAGKRRLAPQTVNWRTPTTREIGQSGRSNRS